MKFEKYLQNSILFLNLETVISPQRLENSFKENKVFNFQSNGKQLIELRKITKDIFVSIANNHSLDFGEKGLKNTITFLFMLFGLSVAIYIW